MADRIIQHPTCAGFVVLLVIKSAAIGRGTVSADDWIQVFWGFFFPRLVRCLATGLWMPQSTVDWGMGWGLG